MIKGLISFTKSQTYHPPTYIHSNSFFGNYNSKDNTFIEDPYYYEDCEPAENNNYDLKLYELKELF